MIEAAAGGRIQRYSIDGLDGAEYRLLVAARNSVGDRSRYAASQPVTSTRGWCGWETPSSALSCTESMVVIVASCVVFLCLCAAALRYTRCGRRCIWRVTGRRVVLSASPRAPPNEDVYAAEEKTYVSGVGWGGMLRPKRAKTADGEPMRQRVEELRDMLAAERASRRAMESEVASLRAELAAALAAAGRPCKSAGGGTSPASAISYTSAASATEPPSLRSTPRGGGSAKLAEVSRTRGEVTPTRSARPETPALSPPPTIEDRPIGCEMLAVDVPSASAPVPALPLAPKGRSPAKAAQDHESALKVLHSEIHERVAQTRPHGDGADGASDVRGRVERAREAGRRACEARVRSGAYAEAAQGRRPLVYDHLSSTEAEASARSESDFSEPTAESRMLLRGSGRAARAGQGSTRRAGSADVASLEVLAGQKAALRRKMAEWEAKHEAMHGARATAELKRSDVDWIAIARQYKRTSQRLLALSMACGGADEAPSKSSPGREPGRAGAPAGAAVEPGASRRAVGGRLGRQPSTVYEEGDAGSSAPSSGSASSTPESTARLSRATCAVGRRHGPPSASDHRTMRSTTSRATAEQFV